MTATLTKPRGVSASGSLLRQIVAAGDRGVALHEADLPWVTDGTHLKVFRALERRGRIERRTDGKWYSKGGVS